MFADGGYQGIARDVLHRVPKTHRRRQRERPAAQVRNDLDFLAEDIVQVKCMTAGVLINTADEYHFTITLASRAIPFTLTNLLESLEPTEYSGEIKDLENKARDFLDSTGNPIVGKRLCSKVNSLLRDFSVIKVKLDAQRALASSRSVGNSPNRPPTGSQGSVDTAGRAPSTSRRKAKRRSSSTGRAQPRTSNLNPAATSRRPVGTSSASEVDHPSMKEAMTQIPSSYDERATPDYKHITAVYKKFWEECEDAYIFGVDFRKDVSIERLKNVPADFNIRVKEDRLVQAMVVYLLNLPHRKARQTLCIMPIGLTSKPQSWEEIKDGSFYVINGQHSVAASLKICDSTTGVDDDIKNDFRVWSCFVVWSEDSEILRSISAYYNRINHFEQVQASWATNILGARKVWDSMGCPENPSQITAAGTTVQRRAADIQSRTKKFKVSQSDESI